ncbi:hypothetical protein B0H14DRAFT_3492722 [Mycena olivaceomarginata]|nr:hypothetical protein B0H14DRAFT_3492722 [Mycena olivaceomarginata]
MKSGLHRGCAWRSVRPAAEFARLVARRVVKAEEVEAEEEASALPQPPPDPDCMSDHFTSEAMAHNSLPEIRKACRRFPNSRRAGTFPNYNPKITIVSFSTRYYPTGAANAANDEPKAGTVVDRVLDPEPLLHGTSPPTPPPAATFADSPLASVERSAAPWTNRIPPPLIVPFNAPVSVRILWPACRRGLRAPLQQMLGLLELGPRAYEQEGPGVLYIQFRPSQFKVGHTDWLPRRLDQYRECQRFGHQVETWVCCPTPIGSSQRVAHLLLNSLGAKAPSSPCPGCGIKHREFYWYSRIGGRRTILRIVRLAIWLTGGTFCWMEV